MTIRKKSDDVRINERIRSSSVRLISAEGEQLGILSIRDAIQVAKDGGLDLVEVAPNSDPPVCRVMDYGKFRYQARKKCKRLERKAGAVR